MLVFLYLAPVKAPASVVFGTFINGGGFESDAQSVLVGAVTIMYAFNAVDGATHMGKSSLLLCTSPYPLYVVFGLHFFSRRNRKRSNRNPLLHDPHSPNKRQRRFRHLRHFYFLHGAVGGSVDGVFWFPVCDCFVEDYEFDGWDECAGKLNKWRIKSI